MKRLSFISLVAFTALLFSSCKKDSETAIVQTGTIRYNNNSSNRYEVFLDGASYGLLNGGYYWDKTSVPVGSHIVKAVQYEGYLLYPTIVENTVNLSVGSTLQFDFP